MQLKFDWLIVLENLCRGIMVTDTTLEGPKTIAFPPIENPPSFPEEPKMVLPP